MNNSLGRKSCRPLLSATLALALFSLVLGGVPATARASEDPGIAAKEERARELVGQAIRERQAFRDRGSTGPRDFEQKFREAARLLGEIVLADPSAPRLYGLAFALFHVGEHELAHFYCGRVPREFPAETQTQQRCEALTSVLHDDLFRVDINSEPGGARVTVAGWPEGATRRTPGALWLRPGLRRLRFEREGYETLERRIEVNRDTVTQVAVQLARKAAPGSLEFVLEPNNATVLLNGQVIDVPQDGVISIPPGEYGLRVQLEGYLPHEERLRVQPNRRERVRIKLARSERERRVERAPRPARPPRSDEYWRNLAITGWTGVGVGGASVLVGAIMHVMAAVRADEANDLSNFPWNIERYGSLRDEAHAYEKSAWILYGVGGALLGAGATLLVVQTLGQGDAEHREGVTVGNTEVTPLILPDGVGIGWQARF